MGESIMAESSPSYSRLWDSQLFQEFTEDPIKTTLKEFDESLQYFSRNFLDYSTFSDSACEDEISSDFSSNDFNKFLTVNTVSDSFLSQVLDESSSLDWSLLDDVHSYPLPIENSSCSPKETAKKIEKFLNYSSHKSWSKMSHEERFTTLHSLSEIVTFCMGISEQIEIIKIINPKAEIAPDDKEFALDVTSLNDTKMKRIKEIIQKKKYASGLSRLSSSPKNFSCGPFTEKQLNKIKKTNSKTKRKKQRSLTNESIRQKRKFEEHGQKEVQSGLFVYEKLIKKQSNPLEEDEDVNILE